MFSFYDSQFNPFFCTINPGATRLRVGVKDSKIAELYGHRLVLVRPDGHVAWRSDDEPEKPAAVIDIIRGALPHANLLSTR